MSKLIIIGLVMMVVFCPAQQQLLLSTSPTLSELKSFLVKTKPGEHNAIDVLGKIIERKEKSIPALEAFLNESSNKDSVTDYEPNKLYAVLALEAIGTKDAYAVLSQAATGHPETAVKGTAIRALAGSYYSRVETDSLPPKKEFILILLRNCDDVTYVEFCNKRIGEIAREGIKNWTGMDYGDLSLEQKTIKVGKSKTEMTPQQYREWWWDKYQDKLVWNKEKMKYQMVN